MSKNKKIIVIITIIIGISVLISITKKGTNTVIKEENEQENILEVEEKDNIEEEKIKQEEVEVNNSEIQTEKPTTDNKHITNNTQQLANEPSTNNNQTITNTNNNQITPNTDSNQSSTEDDIKKEVEEATKKWFIAQYNVSKQQYINSINNSITETKSQISNLEEQANTLYKDYMQKVKK